VDTGEAKHIEELTKEAHQVRTDCYVARGEIRLRVFSTDM
jgi:hypothetical protein